MGREHVKTMLKTWVVATIALVRSEVRSKGQMAMLA
jgi:hypothetical protein